MKRGLFFLTIVILCFLLSGCGNDPSPPYEPKTTYIDESLLLESSEFLSGSFTWGDDYVFDFNSIPLVQNGSYNDFELAYWTSSSLDEDVWVYNFKKARWDQIGFSPGPDVMGYCVLTEHYHLFSAKRLKANEYLDFDLKMMVHGAEESLRARALKIHPDYFTVPVLLGGLYGFNGLTYDGENFWVSSNFSNKIYNLSLEEEVLREFEAPSGYPFGLAFDGQNLWNADGSNCIFKLTLEGNVISQFTVPTDYPGGLAWGLGKLWLSEYGRLFGTPQIFGINPSASCSAGFAVITDTFQTPGERCWGLAWDGTYLLVVTQNYYDGTSTLFRMTTNGEEVQSFELPVKYPRDIAWDGEAVWILSYGPKELMSYDPVIARFKLR